MLERREVFLLCHSRGYSPDGLALSPLVGVRPGVQEDFASCRFCFILPVVDSQHFLRRFLNV